MGHHYVPQEYLRGFEAKEDPGLIWMYDKMSRDFRKVPMAAAAQATGFYDPDTERRLNEVVEGPAHAALGRIRKHQQLLPGDREALAGYVAVMLMRVPARRRRSMAMFPSVVDKVMGDVSALVEGWAKDPRTDPQLARRRRIEVEQARERFLQEPPEEVIARVRSPWPSKRVLEAVHSMTWRIVVAPKDNAFLTCDNPAFFFESLGLGRPESELTFPLAPDLALLGNWQGERESLLVVQPRPRVAKEINRRVASGAERFVFCDERRDWVATLADKRQHSLNRIQW